MYRAIFEKDNLENVANNKKLLLSLIIIFWKEIGKGVGKKEEREEGRKERERTA